MRPTDSAYDRSMASSEATAREILDPSAANVGDTLSYDGAEEMDDAGRHWLRDRLARRDLVLQDDGDGYVVVAACAHCGREAPASISRYCGSCGEPPSGED